MSNVTVHENLIQDALREAIEKIKAGIDLEKMKRIIQERFGVGAIATIDLQEMHAVAHEGQIAFRCFPRQPHRGLPGKRGSRCLGRTVR